MSGHETRRRVCEILRRVGAGTGLGVTMFGTGLGLVLVFAWAVVLSRSDLREEIHRRLIERDAAVLYPVALQQLEESSAASAGREVRAEELLGAVLKSARMRDYLFAVTVFDLDGKVIRSLPSTQLLAEISPGDYPRLVGLERISRYHERFPLGRYFGGLAEGAGLDSPVLEILLPLPADGKDRLLGFAQYYIDGRPLARELASLDARISRQTFLIIAVGALFIALIMAAAYWGLRRAQRQIAERNDRLARANFELVLAAKASALGQITSHLLHGLQGSVAGLRAVVTGRPKDDAEAEDWRCAADYTERMQSLIAEAVAMLSDSTSPAGYELSGEEMTAIIVSRNQRQADESGVVLSARSEAGLVLDSRRANLLCLIACNLLQNAFYVVPRGRAVRFELVREGQGLGMRVIDEGPGIPETLRTRLFEPGASGRKGGSGLGLAISRLLARQLGGDLELVRTGPEGSEFRVIV